MVCKMLNNSIHILGDVRAIGSNRTVGETTNFLQVRNCVLTGVGVAPYLGRELQNYKELGLDGEKTYFIYRPLEEVVKAKDTFNLLPVLDIHTPIDSKHLPAKYTLGTSGETAVIEGGELKNTVGLWNQEAIDAVFLADKDTNKGKKDLSCGYTYELVPEEGMYQGKPYQFKMINLKGNHIALVEDGRHPTAQIADHNTVQRGEAYLKNTLMALDAAKKNAHEALLALARDTEGEYEGKEDDHIDAIFKAVKELKEVQKNEKLSQDELETTITSKSKKLPTTITSSKKSLPTTFKDSKTMENAKQKKEEMELEDAAPEKEDEKADDEMSAEDKKKAADKKPKAKKKAKEDDESDDCASDEDVDDCAKDSASHALMDEAIKSSVREQLMLSNQIMSYGTAILGRLSPSFAADSGYDANKMVDKILEHKGFTPANRSMEAKLAMLEVLEKNKVAAPQYVGDSAPVSPRRKTNFVNPLAKN